MFQIMETRARKHARIIFTQALRAGSSNSVLDGSLDGDVSFTNFMNNVVMNITY